MQGQVIEKRDQVEQELMAILDCRLGSGQRRNFASDALRFFKLAVIIPLATVEDLTRALYDSSWFSNFNPLRREHHRIYDLIIYWHRCCVLEDKIARLVSIHDDNDIVQELLVVRRFDPAQHQRWLAFEVENGLQIRPEQAVIALHLLYHPSAIVQLNMGLGKTRVILPMLVLPWSAPHYSNERRVTRLNVLSNLLSEAKDYFSGALTAILSRTKIYMLPFCRDVALNQKRIASLRGLMRECRRSRGYFLAAPEHRLSLELKVTELRRSGQSNLARSLHETVQDSRHWREVLDESDELLHHRFRLIYATGSVSELPEASHRYGIPVFLLARLCSSRKLIDWIRCNPEFVIREGGWDYEAFPLYTSMDVVS